MSSATAGCLFDELEAMPDPASPTLALLAARLNEQRGRGRLFVCDVGPERRVAHCYPEAKPGIVGEAARLLEGVVRSCPKGWACLRRPPRVDRVVVRGRRGRGTDHGRYVLASGGPRIRDACRRCDQSRVLALLFAAPPLGEEELRVLVELIPRLRRRLAVERRIVEARRDRETLMAVLEAVAMPAFLMSGMAVQLANGAGWAALERDRRSTHAALRQAITGSPGRQAIAIEVSGTSAHHLVIVGGAAGEAQARASRLAVRLGLSARRAEVLGLVALGYSNRTIAEELCTAEHTVELHVGALLHAAGVGSRTQLVARVWTDSD